MNKILIAVICYNEIKTIGELLDKIKLLPSLHKFDVVIFDDCSDDGSVEVVQKCGFNFITNKATRGYSSNVMNSFSYFMNNEVYNSIILMDADLEHDPDYIELFINKYPNADLVIGNRSHKNRWAENISGVFFSLIGSRIDPFCGMRKISRSFLQEFLQHNNSYYDGVSLPVFWAKTAAHFQLQSLPIKVGVRQDLPRFGKGLKSNLKLLSGFARALRYVKS
ncbi:glycosyltransferase family 2 protein [Lentibacter algarum]|uniref:glycosyltransferase family 2 protein n=1 Tax=Lentibacter algarum TaxID=576131 RepID=UPI00339D94F7